MSENDDAPETRPCAHCGRSVPQRSSAGRPFRYCRDNDGECQRASRNMRMRHRSSPGLAGQVARTWEVVDRLDHPDGDAHRRAALRALPRRGRAAAGRVAGRDVGADRRRAHRTRRRPPGRRAGRRRGRGRPAARRGRGGRARRGPAPGRGVRAEGRRRDPDRRGGARGPRRGPPGGNRGGCAARTGRGRPGHRPRRADDGPLRAAGDPPGAGGHRTRPGLRPARLPDRARTRRRASPASATRPERRPTT